MNVIEHAIESNPFIQSCPSTTFTVLFNDHDRWNDQSIEFILALIKYPNWKPKTDLFQYVRPFLLDRIRSDPKCFFVFDASTEGFSPFQDTFFFDILYHNCKKYKVPANKIIFTSSNMKDEKNIRKYNVQHNIKKSITVFPFLSFRKMIKDLIEIEYGKKDGGQHIQERINKTKELFKDRFVLSLSRVNRPYRSLGTYLLATSPIAEYASISHNKLSNGEIRSLVYDFDLWDESVKDWAGQLPMVIDTGDFQTNHALSVNSHLHDSTLFQIVNETHVDNFDDTSLFFSEKTFRSMVHFQPFLIYGQRYCNTRLKELGFQIFDNLFDYSFDSVKDNKKRYLALLESASSAVYKLETMTKEEQIAWKFSCRKKLMHNFNLVMGDKFESEKFKDLVLSVRKIAYAKINRKKT